MRQRRAGQLVIEKLLTEQASIAPRSAIARFFGLSPLGSRSRSWYAGALGEIAVGRILDSLPSGWSTFHALPIGKADSDIDHLVVGPGGIFVINTKHHSGKKIWVSGRGFLVDGQKTHYISNSESEANKVTALLTRSWPQLPPAKPVIILVSPRQITIKNRPETVAVLDSRYLRRWLVKQPVGISPDECTAIVDRVSDPGAWRLEGAETEGSADLFDALHHEVGAARARRLLWLGIAAIVTAVVAFEVLSHI